MLNLHYRRRDAAITTQPQRANSIVWVYFILFYRQIGYFYKTQYYTAIIATTEVKSPEDSEIGFKHYIVFFGKLWL